MLLYIAMLRNIQKNIQILFSLVKNGNLDQADSEYKLIEKKIKTKILKNIWNLFSFRNI